MMTDYFIASTSCKRADDCGLHFFQNSLVLNFFNVCLQFLLFYDLSFWAWLYIISTCITSHLTGASFYQAAAQRSLTLTPTLEEKFNSKLICRIIYTFEREQGVKWITLIWLWNMIANKKAAGCSLLIKVLKLTIGDGDAWTTELVAKNKQIFYIALFSRNSI